MNKNEILNEINELEGTLERELGGPELKRWTRLLRIVRMLLILTGKGKQ